MTGEPTLFDQAAAAWWMWALPIASQAAIVALVAAAVDLACRRRARPRLQTLVWAAVLVKFLLPPWLSSPVSVVHLVTEPPLATDESVVPSWIVRTAALVWLAGAAILAAWVLARLRRQRVDLERATTPATENAKAALAAAAREVGLQRVPAARLVESAADAAVVGIVRPVVLVPRELLGDGERLRHVLLHECAHLRRGDPWWALAALIATILAWPHPVAWLARHRLAALRELACDEHVARALGDGGRTYRATLKEVARAMLAAASPSSPGRLAFVVPGWPGSSLLLARLQHLRLGVAPRRPIDAVACSLAAGVLAVALLPLSNPPVPPAVLWLRAEGCMQKRLLFLHWLAHEPPSTSTTFAPPRNSNDAPSTATDFDSTSSSAVRRLRPRRRPRRGLGCNAVAARPGREGPATG